jgi:hypothetical protein
MSERVLAAGELWTALLEEGAHAFLLILGGKQKLVGALLEG